MLHADRLKDAARAPAWHTIQLTAAGPTRTALQPAALFWQALPAACQHPSKAKAGAAHRAPPRAPPARPIRHTMLASTFTGSKLASSGFLAGQQLQQRASVRQVRALQAAPVPASTPASVDKCMAARPDPRRGGGLVGGAARCCCCSGRQPVRSLLPHSALACCLLPSRCPGCRAADHRGGPQEG